MQNFNNKGNRGISIIGILLLGFILILVLGYFKISVRGVVESPGSQENIEYVKDTSRSFWEKYLKDPADYLWNDVWVDIFWQGFINNMERIRDGKPTDLDTAADNLKVQY
ncbi:MAG: hypothetical protein WD963_00290 [Candidatus Paceibacterota bacterium]